MTNQYLYKQFRKYGYDEHDRTVYGNDILALRNEMSWVNLQSKKMEGLTKVVDMTRMCIITKSGQVNVDLNMQKQRLRNLPLPLEYGALVGEICFSIHDNEMSKFMERK